MGKNSILGNQYKIDNKNTTMIKSNSLTATQIAWGLLHKISEIPRFANVLLLGWVVSSIFQRSEKTFLGGFPKIIGDNLLSF